MKTVGDLNERNAKCYPQALAVVHGTRKLSFQDLAQRGRQLASALHELGMGHQDRLGILSSNSIEYVEALSACEHAGYIAALYNFRCAPPELQWLVEDSAPKIVLFESALAKVVDSVRLKFPGVIWLCAGTAVPEWAQSFEALLASGNAGGVSTRANAEDVAYLFFTSGTTGRPKGVPWSHQAALFVAMREGATLGAAPRVLHVAPTFHVGGKAWLLGAAYRGGCSFLMSSFEPRQFMQTIAEQRITSTFMVPMMMQATLDLADIASFDSSSLRSVMAASTAIPVPLLRRAIATFGPVFFVAYGSTEMANVSALEPFEMRPDGSEEDVKRLGSAGRIHPYVEATILSSEGRTCSPGEVGEVCVKSPVFQGYWNNTVATLDALRGGWFHSGDLGYIDEYGIVYLVDRLKDMIISGGENIYSREVETALARHPAVQAVAVFGIPDDKWGEAVKASVVLAPGQSADAASLIEHCQREIARYKCPRHIEFVTALPMTGTGKIDKVKLRQDSR